MAGQNLLLIGAVLCEASYAVIGKKLTGGALGPRRITAIINLWGFALTTPSGLWLAWDFDFGAVAPGIWLLLFYGLAASVWTVWLWMTGLRTVPAAQAGVFTVLLPISAALVGVLALGERLDSLQLAAFALALVGMVLATWPSYKAKNSPLQ